MSEDAQFLRALQESPAADTARLVYADWLEARGDPRNEYLPLYCRISQDARRLRVLRQRGIFRRATVACLISLPAAAVRW
jgi:uncharacterized protein (TIGR02996 family)